MPDPKIIRTISDMRRLKAGWAGSGRVALVPTMGALHEGHFALVRAVRATAEHVVVSIFVNPTQFAPNEDFTKYPRNEAADVALLAAEGVDAIFAPAVAEMYPPDFATSVAVAGPAEGLETEFRPNFFRGVATVVTKLLLAVLPDFAIFGEKDYQQLAVIRRMTRDLAIPVEIVGHPTIRDDDGLALSSRNAYLTASERNTALRLHAVLTETAAGIRAQASPMELLIAARTALEAAGFRVDYVELRNADTLAPPLGVNEEPLRLLAAAWLGKTRLIDNVAV